MVTLDLTHGTPPAPMARRVWRQALFDLGNALRNGENLLLTLVIPVGVLILTLKSPLAGDRSAGQALVGKRQSWQVGADQPGVVTEGEEARGRTGRRGNARVRRSRRRKADEGRERRGGGSRVRGGC